MHAAAVAVDWSCDASCTHPSMVLGYIPSVVTRLRLHAREREREREGERERGREKEKEREREFY